MKLDDFNMVSFVPLNIKDQESVSNLLCSIDNALQYGEDQDVNISKEIEDSTDEWIQVLENYTSNTTTTTTISNNNDNN
jgi:formyltetrahydrofolate synthetase